MATASWRKAVTSVSVELYVSMTNGGQQFTPVELVVHLAIEDLDLPGQASNWRCLVVTAMAMPCLVAAKVIHSGRPRRFRFRSMLCFGIRAVCQIRDWHHKSLFLIG
nr:hypothetical protein CFP56_11577 [Quercus suber]